ncbi:MAG: phosphatase PAP2 family protein [Sediminibacterium sp.]|nr:phosphatase PAP2 family protein [Sediminibacterium sp.]
MKKVLFITIYILLIELNLSAQAQWEVDAVMRINPENPNNSMWKGLSASSEPIALAAPLGMFALSLINHNKTLKLQSAEVMGSLVIATAATQILKRVVNRPRPYETYTNIFPDKIDNGYSFPSGHTTTAFSTAMSLTLVTKKWYVAVPAFAWATGVGYSRIYLGQHYPSDVFMGALVGTASGFASHWLMKKIMPAKKESIKQIP